MLHIAPSGRIRVKLPACVCSHLLPATTMVVAVALAACFRVVRSIAPAIDDAAALDVPGFVGVWNTADGARWEVTRDTGAVPSYHIAVGPVLRAETIARRARDDRAYLEARIGRVGPVLVLEMRPDLDRDTVLARLSDRYSYQLERLYMVERLELHGDRFITIWVEQDSVESAVRDGRCATPFFPDTARGMILSGTSAQVRAALGCTLALPGFTSDSTVFQREPIPRAIAGH